MYQVTLIKGKHKKVKKYLSFAELLYWVHRGQEKGFDCFLL